MRSGGSSKRESGGRSCQGMRSLLSSERVVRKAASLASLALLLLEDVSACSLLMPSVTVGGKEEPLAQSLCLSLTF